MTGRQMKAAREKMAMSQADLGRAIGYKLTQISRMENGWVRVPKVVGVAIDGLLARHEARLGLPPANPYEEGLRALKRALEAL